MLFSIVTITYNHLSGLKSTAGSLKKQICDDYEWIIIDGASSDGTAAYLEEVSADITSEPDDGIYDAMNKGIERAQGEYVLFLNAGDTLADDQVLFKIKERLLQEKHTPDFIYGDALESNHAGKIFYKPARPVKRQVFGMITHHQSMFYRRDTVGDLRYDMFYQIAADYKFTSQFLKKAQGYLYIPAPLCCFEPGGVSQRQAKQARNEQYQIRAELSMASPLLNNAIYYIQTVMFMLKRGLPHIYWVSRSHRNINP